jgi:GDP/UDP-N,N'-diacetylbacillosamine 2-epimerase (hydrolysing)
MKRKICVVTGSRAEYGILKPLLEKIRDDSEMELQLITTGMHLSSEFGLTYKEIERDGFDIAEKVEILLSSDTPVAISKSMGLAMMSFAEVFERLKPKIVVVVGDRFEIFSAVSSACISRIPVAHIHGGEVTEGSFDDSLRHSITKMSILHFTSTEEYRKRVIQLGEHPERVFNVGALGLDNIRKMELLSREELEKELDFEFLERNLLVTFHPVTLEKNTSREQFQTLLSVLDGLPETNLIFTKTNADTDGRIINRMIDEYVSENPKKAISFTSMGQLKYLSTMQFVDAVIGNSSSGIIEAPSFRIGTINIGDRQKGRVKAESVIDCEPEIESIREAIRKLYSEDFQRVLKSVVNPYGDGRTAERILKILKSYDKLLLKKGFYDIQSSR